MSKQVWDKRNIPDLSGKVIIVTGGNSGLGYESVKAFAEKGARGALPQIRAAVDHDVSGGEYYGPSGMGEMKGYPVRVKSNGKTHDREAALKLWEVSEELTGVKIED